MPTSTYLSPPAPYTLSGRMPHIFLPPERTSFGHFSVQGTPKVSSTKRQTARETKQPSGL